jgi:hypothetical protein
VQWRAEQLKVTTSTNLRNRLRDEFVVNVLAIDTLSFRIQASAERVPEGKAADRLQKELKWTVRLQAGAVGQLDDGITD